MQEQTPPAPLDRELIGSTLAGRYRIHELIARGGMGRLYRAEQVPLGRMVAVKIMVPTGESSTDSLQARFFREAATCARLRHPNTVTLFDYGEVDLAGERTFYMVMEFIEGRTLRQVLHDEKRLSPGRTLRIGLEIARSLREAHGQGVVHRDLKPSNVMLVPGDEGERVKVLDFGVAKLLSSAAESPTSGEELTRVGEMVGSPSHMSPEQILGQDVDARSDLYSLGVLLYQLLSGRTPFRGVSTATIMVGHLQKAPPLISEITGQAPPPRAVELLIRRCLEKKPADRFRDADELIAAIQAVLAELADTESDSVVDLPVESPQTNPGGGRAAPPPVRLAAPAPAPPAPAPDLTPPSIPTSPTLAAPADPPAAAPSRLPLVLALAILAPLLLLAAGGGLWALSTVLAEPPPAAGPAITEEIPAPPAIPATEVLVTSDPTGATVYERERPLGVTPLRIQIPSGFTGTRELDLRLEGHQAARAAWRPGDGPELAVKLTPTAAPRTGPRPPPRDKPKSGGGEPDIVLER